MIMYKIIFFNVYICTTIMLQVKHISNSSLSICSHIIISYHRSWKVIDFVKKNLRPEILLKVMEFKMVFYFMRVLICK